MPIFHITRFANRGALMSANSTFEASTNVRSGPRQSSTGRLRALAVKTTKRSEALSNRG